MSWYFDYDEPLFRPPSEAHSLIFQATIGCSQNHCTFCGMYKEKRFRIRPLEELRQEIAAVPAHHRPHVQRIFLGDGDALVYPQQGLLDLLSELSGAFPSLARVGAYASPNSLRGKSVEDLAALRERKLRILYFGLESGDDETLASVKKGFSAAEMLGFCRQTQAAGLKLSVTAILGLAGKERTLEHARATAEWVSALSPEYFSLLTLFHRHNEDFYRSITPLSNGEILEEAAELLRHLTPRKTILRSNHVSNILNLSGNYPKDRERLLAEAEGAVARARLSPTWYGAVPDYREEHF